MRLLGDHVFAIHLNLYHEWLALETLLETGRRVILDGQSLDIPSIVAIAMYGTLLMFYGTQLKLHLLTDMVLYLSSRQMARC